MNKVGVSMPELNHVEPQICIRFRRKSTSACALQAKI